MFHSGLRREALALYSAALIAAGLGYKAASAEGLSYNGLENAMGNRGAKSLSSDMQADGDSANPSYLERWQASLNRRMSSKFSESRFLDGHRAKSDASSKGGPFYVMVPENDTTAWVAAYDPGSRQWTKGKWPSRTFYGNLDLQVSPDGKRILGVGGDPQDPDIVCHEIERVLKGTARKPVDFVGNPDVWTTSVAHSPEWMDDSLYIDLEYSQDASETRKQRNEYRDSGAAARHRDVIYDNEKAELVVRNANTRAIEKRLSLMDFGIPDGYATELGNVSDGRVLAVVEFKGSSGSGSLFGDREPTDVVYELDLGAKKAREIFRADGGHITTPFMADGFSAFIHYQAWNPDDNEYAVTLIDKKGDVLELTPSEYGYPYSFGFDKGRLIFTKRNDRENRAATYFVLNADNPGPLFREISVTGFPGEGQLRLEEWNSRSNLHVMFLRGNE